MPLFAGDVKADPVLTALLGQTAKGPQNDIRSVYDRLKGAFRADQAARGVRGGSYAGDRLNASQTQAESGLQTGLEDILGSTSYKNTLAERDASLNEALGREIG